MEFRAFPKIPRLYRDCVITEKIDGTNGCVVVSSEGEVTAQSRNRVLTPQADNFGFARWVEANKAQLLELGPGYHYGEWWGLGIQRGYGLKERRFSLFNVARWTETAPPECCNTVPVLYRGLFSDAAIEEQVTRLWIGGSVAAPGFVPAEGVVVYHEAAQRTFKVLCENDEQSKGELCASV